MDAKVDCTIEARTAGEPFDVDLGIRMRRYRIRKKMTLQALGEHVGVTYQQIQKYETGRNRVSIATGVRIAEVLDYSLMDLARPRDASEIKTLTEYADVITPQIMQTSVEMASLPLEKRKLVLDLVKTLSNS